MAKLATTENNTPFLQASQLFHRFGPTEILENINFTLEAGKVISIVGPSGGGKTTLLHLCGDLLDVTDGKVINRFESQAFAFQDARLLPWLTALENIAFSLKAKGVAKNHRRKLAAKMAYRLGLVKEDLDKFPKDLSGGMRQRVAFARALVLEPELLFLDEPFSALDIGLKRELQSLLIEWVTNKNLSIFFITHDLAEAVQLSDEILVLDADPGRIVKRVKIEKCQSERDGEFIHQQIRMLLDDPLIIETFELNFNNRQQEAS